MSPAPTKSGAGGSGYLATHLIARLLRDGRYIRPRAAPNAAGNRFLAVSNDPATSFLEIAQLLHRHLGVQTRTEEAPGSGLPRPIIHNARARNSSTGRPAETTILETAQSLQALGLLTPDLR